MNEIVFNVHYAPEDGFTAWAVGQDISTGAATWGGLQANILEAVQGHFNESAAPQRILIQYEASRWILITDPHHGGAIPPPAVDLPDDSPGQHAPLVSGSVILILAGSILAGLLAGTLVFFILFTLISILVGPVIGLLFLAIFPSILGCGFVTGRLLSIFYLQNSRHQPLQIFVCSPFTILVFGVLIATVYQGGVGGIRDLVSSADFVFLCVFMIVYWIGALIGRAGKAQAIHRDEPRASQEQVSGDAQVGDGRGS